MDFELSNRQKQIRLAAREFAEGMFPQFVEDCDLNETFPIELWKKACELGFIGVFIKKEYGGLDLGCFENGLIAEEFWRIDAGCGNIILSTLGSEFILLYGSEDQKKKYLPLLTKGQAIMGMAITEPDAGSDVSSIRTSAEKRGDHYVIHGNKMYITNGNIAHFLVVFCLTNETEPSRFKRHSAIIVETDSKGYEGKKLIRKLGARASETAEIRFTNVEVPRGNLIGPNEGDGFQQLMGVFNRTRITVAAQGVGIAQGGLEKAIKYAKERKQFGSPIASFQGIEFKLAEMVTLIEGARGFYYRAAWMADNGKIDPKIMSIAKWYAGEVAVKVIDEVLQIHGGYGYLGESGIERMYRDAKIVEIVEGTKESEKMIIARELLGRF